MLLALTTYPVVRKALSYSMEQYPVSFRLFSNVAFTGISIGSFGALCFEKPQLRVRSIFSRRTGLYLAIALIILYVLIFPTYLSAMTGYQASMTPFAQDPLDANSLLFLDNVEAAYMVVLDGSRVGFTDFWAFRNEDFDGPLNADLEIFQQCRHQCSRR